MKLLLVLLVLGYTSASVYDAFDEAADELVRDFMIGMNDAPSLKRALVLADDTDADGIENDIKDKFARRLREVLEKIIQKIKDAIEKGKVVKEEVIEKLKELKEKVKNEKAIGDKAKDLYEKIKEKAKDFLKKILENLGDDDEKAFSEANVELADFNIFSLLKKLKELVSSSNSCFTSPSSITITTIFNPLQDEGFLKRLSNIHDPKIFFSNALQQFLKFHPATFFLNILLREFYCLGSSLKLEQSIYDYFYSRDYSTFIFKSFIFLMMSSPLV